MAHGEVGPETRAASASIDSSGSSCGATTTGAALPLPFPGFVLTRFSALPSAASSSDEEEDEDDEEELDSSLSLRTGFAGTLTFFRMAPVSGSASSELELVDDAGGLDAAAAAAFARRPFVAAAGRARGAGRGLRMKKSSSCAMSYGVLDASNAHRRKQAVR